MANSLLDDDSVQKYLEESVRTWIGVPRGAGVEIPRLPSHLSRLFLRVEEYECPHRDQWGCWEFGLSANFRAGRLWVPEVDQWTAERRRELAGRVPLEPLWPNKKTFAICLTHDVDRVSHVPTPRQALRSVRTQLVTPRDSSGRERIKSLIRAARTVGGAAYHGVARAPSTLETLERCVAVEKENGVVGSYFFTVYPVRRSSPYDCVYTPNDLCTFRGRRRRISEVIREIADDGFDVGLHGSYHSALDADILASEKMYLEDAVGLSVTTTRQHWLHWDIRVTPQLQEAAGFRADSTLGFNRNVGFRAGTSMPFRHFDLGARQVMDIIQVPLIVQEGPLFDESGLELGRDLAKQVVKQLVDAVAEVGGVVTFLFHPNNLVNPDVLALYRWSLEYGLDRGAWVTSLKNIETWWRERMSRLAGSC